MKFFKSLIISGIVLGFSFSSSFSAGRTGGRILNMDVNPRVAALAGAYTARATDAAGVTENPAALLRLYASEVILSHSFYLVDSSISSLTAASRLGKFALGLEWKRFGSEDVFRDAMGAGKETFDNSYTQLTFSGAFPINQRISAGLSLISISEKLYKDTASALAFNAGFYILGFRGDSYGLVVKNLGGEIKHQEEGSGLDMEVCLGGAHRMGAYIFSWEVLSSKEIDLGWRAALEYDLEALILRGGFSYLNETDYALGFGIPYGRWSFDYSFSPHRDFSPVHRMSVSSHF